MLIRAVEVEGKITNVFSAGLVRANTNPEDEVVEHDLINATREMLLLLHPDKREVLMRRFSIDYPEGQDLKTIAKEMGLSEKRVKKIEHDALCAMKSLSQRLPFSETFMP